MKKEALKKAKKLEKEKIPDMEDLKKEDKELEREEESLKKMLKQKRKLK